MFMTDFVRVCRSADLDRLRAPARALDRAVITPVLLPSDQVIATWEIEVSTDGGSPRACQARRSARATWRMSVSSASSSNGLAQWAAAPICWARSSA